jgi:hypothetical protein
MLRLLQAYLNRHAFTIRQWIDREIEERLADPADFHPQR